MKYGWWLWFFCHENGDYGGLVMGRALEQPSVVLQVERDERQREVRKEIELDLRW